jgi:hypothetical protein
MELVSSGDIAPAVGPQYVVAFKGDHKTLAVGDVVVVREAANYTNVFVRVPDLTIHPLQSNDGYVIVAPHHGTARPGATMRVSVETFARKIAAVVGDIPQRDAVADLIARYITANIEAAVAAERGKT